VLSHSFAPLARKAQTQKRCLGDYAANRERWEKPETRADYQRQMELEIRRWRNHPSIVMWGTSGNALGSSMDDSDPWTLGRPELTVIQESITRRQRVAQAMTMIKTVDPTRPIFGHHSDDGEVHTSNMYLNFIPLQEREEWLSQWVRSGTVPWMAFEFGPPLYASFMRGRDGYTHQGHSEPFLSEWTARYLETEAYRLEPEAYRQLIIDRYKGGDLQHEYETNPRKESPTREWNADPGMTETAKALVALNAPSTGWQKVSVPAYLESYGPK
jgi:hypothetical protein